jgi:hypothetical protein
MANKIKQGIEYLMIDLTSLFFNIPIKKKATIPYSQIVKHFTKIS